MKTQTENNEEKNVNERNLVQFVRQGDVLLNDPRFLNESRYNTTIKLLKSTRMVEALSSRFIAKTLLYRCYKEMLTNARRIGGMSDDGH